MKEKTNNIQASSPTQWHASSVDAIFQFVSSTQQGLTEEEAKSRLQKYGLNRLRPPPKKGAIARFLAQFHNVLIYVLIASGIITALLNHWIDSGVIFAVVVVNALIGFIQEGKAEKALDAIRNLLSQQAAVRRNGTLVVLAADELVPGDIVTIQSGDRVPADLRLFQCKELRIDEAMLTGESVPVEKSTESVASNAVVADRKCLAHAGTYVTYGQAQGIVIATADSTEIGRISGMLGQVQTLTTPLLRQISSFGKWLTMVIGVLAVLTFAFGILFRNYTASEMFIAAVGLAVAAIPEGLPAIITITLAVGVQRMAKRHAIIRRLPAVETLGSVTVICSDKTGTLTRNEMTVQTVATAEHTYALSGVGYNPHGGFKVNKQQVSPEQCPQLKELCQAAMLCNDATLSIKHQQWRVNGDPTEGALIALGVKAGLDQSLLYEELPRTDVIPFESEHRFMATLHHDHAGHAFIYLKGAPERILAMCSHQRVSGEDMRLDHTYWEQRLDQIASLGQRLIAIAFKVINPEQRTLNFNDIDSHFTLLGVVGIIDPPREEAISAVQACQSAGIRVKMITGDHALTARAIGQQMGIGDGRTVVSGDQLETFSEQQLHSAVAETDVFARTSPEQKLQLVQALQADHEVVAMTGDGVNDAPALKRADVGIAMGMKGTEVAKEAAEVVLADDNFATIANAVEEGRTVYDNLKKSILFVLPTNGGEALTIIAAIILGRALPITPVQILWVNMITAVTLALTLAFEPPESNVMNRKPRDGDRPILSPFLIWRVIFVSLILVVGTFGNFIWQQEHGASLETARTIAVNTLVMFEIFYLINVRYLLTPSLSLRSLRGNPYPYIAIGILLVFQWLFTYFGPIQTLFGTTSIDLTAWLQILAIASSVFILVEIEKMIMRRFIDHSAL